MELHFQNIYPVPPPHQAHFAERLHLASGTGKLAVLQNFGSFKHPNRIYEAVWGYCYALHFDIDSPAFAPRRASYLR